MEDRRQVIRTRKLHDIGKFMKAPASPAARGGGLIFTSGYVPIDPKTGRAVRGSIEEQTRTTLQNLKIVLEQAGSSLDKVLKVNIFMSDLNEWPRMNKVYKEFFPGDYPARRTVHAQLVGGFKIEIDCIALE